MKQFLAVIALSLAGAASAQGWRVASDQAHTGFVFPESAAYDAKGKVLYVGSFGGEKLAPGEKDGKGSILKVGMDGKVIETVFPVKGGEPLNKPKGIWIRGDRLWVTDIDAIWIFDLKTKKGRKLALPGVVFANDPALVGKALYVSDNRADKLVKVEPADFLDEKIHPKVIEVISGQNVNPNGVWPKKGGGVLLAGFKSAEEPRGLFSVSAKGELKKLSDPLGRLDGLYEMSDGSILYTDWNTSSLSLFSKKDGVKKLAEGFKGPADFTVIPGAKGKGELTVVVPDLPAGVLRFIKLTK